MCILSFWYRLQLNAFQILWFDHLFKSIFHYFNFLFLWKIAVWGHFEFFISFFTFGFSFSLHSLLFMVFSPLKVKRLNGLNSLFCGSFSLSRNTILECLSVESTVLLVVKLFASITFMTKPGCLCPQKMLIIVHETDHVNEKFKFPHYSNSIFIPKISRHSKWNVCTTPDALILNDEASVLLTRLTLPLIICRKQIDKPLFCTDHLYSNLLSHKTSICKLLYCFDDLILYFCIFI